jgi:GntR family transcriptional regulator/MocR family aminotransferase
MTYMLNLLAKQWGYKELSAAIIERIESGQLTDNTPLPPTRVLADSLGVSRDTVLKCYRHLKSLGWIKSHGTRGTFVSKGRTVSRPSPVLEPFDGKRLSLYALQFQNVIEQASVSAEPVVFSAVPPEFLPVRRWKVATQKTTEPLSKHQPLYDLAVLGRPELREALSGFLNRNRGIPCVPEEIAVFNVSFNALALVCRLFLEPGQTIAMEEPGFGGIREVALYLGLNVLPVRVDKEGMIIEELESSRQPIKLVYVTPDHQEPTGVTMSLARRKQLLSWAATNNAIIIEDAYDGLFYYGANLPPSLKSMDVLYPLTTLCFSVLPLSLVEIIRRAKQSTVGLTESSQQLAMTELLNSGSLQKHVRKLEQLFAARRQTMLFELKRALGSRIHLPSKSCGLTVMAQFNGYSDDVLSQASHKAGLPMISTRSLYCDTTNRSPGEWSIYFPGLDERVTRKVVHSFAENLS